MTYFDSVKLDIEIKVINVGLSEDFGRNIQNNFDGHVSVKTLDSLKNFDGELLKKGANIINVPPIIANNDSFIKNLGSKKILFFLNGYNHHTEEDNFELMKLIRSQILTYRAGRLKELPNEYFFRA